MIDGLIPRRYAKALYKFALENKGTEKIYEEMKEVIGAFESNPSLQKVLANPFVKSQDKEKLLVAAAGDKVEDDYRRFVKLILAHHREEFAYLMALAYRDIYRTENKISRVRIITASELPEDEMSKLRAVVQKAFTDTTLEYTYKIDPKLIGGFVIDVDSARLDASLSNELEQIRQNLLRSN